MHYSTSEKRPPFVFRQTLSATRDLATTLALFLLRSIISISTCWRISRLNRPKAESTVGVVVVEFLVGVPNAGLGEALRQYARAAVDVILVAPAAVDIDAADRLQVVPALRD